MKSRVLNSEVRSGSFSGLKGLIFAGILSMAASRGPAQDWSRSNFVAPPSDVPLAAPAVTENSGGLNPGNRSRGRTANFGKLGLNLGLAGEVEYNDNVRAETNPQAGLTVRAGLRFESTYALTRLQDLSLSGEISNRVPLFGPGRREQLFAVSPDSALRLNIWIKRIRVSPFLKYRRTLDPVRSPVVNGTEILDQAAFTGGVQADLPLHQTQIQILLLQEQRRQRGDAPGSAAGDGEADRLNALDQSSRSQLASLRFLRELPAANMLSADVVLTQTYRVNGPADRVDTVSFGAFDEWQLSRLTTIRYGGGVDLRRFQNSRTLGEPGRLSGPFGTASIQQQLRPRLKTILTFNRSFQDGQNTNYFSLSEIQFAPTYEVFRNCTLGLSGSWQWLRESGPSGETAQRRQVGATFTFLAIAGLQSRLSLDRMVKNSDRATRSYYQDRFTLSFTRPL